MKARRLIEQDGKYNIVYFGSQGIVSEEYEEITTNKLYGGGTTNEVYIYPCLNLNKNEENILTIDVNNWEYDAFYATIKFNYLKNNDIASFSKKYYPDVHNNTFNLDLDDIIKDHPCISNLRLDITNEDTLQEGEFLEYYIDYPKVKLLYGVEPYNEQRNVPNYKEVVSVAYNYSSKQQGVRDSLIARLGIIKGELWYRKSYGLPLLDKIKSKGIFDSIIVGYIMDHPDVIGLNEFTSKLDGHSYKFDCKINTIYNEEIELSNEI
jgi:hypothetical protein